jgi:16S rRNA G966 N2-methylase RsmD
VTDSDQASGEYKCRPHIKLLEIDERFGVFKEFVHYDFEKAIQLPPEMKASFDRIIVDPPFLSEDCQTKGRFKSGSQRILELTTTSCVDCEMAGKVMDPRLSATHCMHRRTYGELDHHKIVRQSRYQDYGLRDQARERLEQRV